MLCSIIVLVIIASVTWFLKFTKTKQRMDKFSENIPSLPSLPVIGSAHLFFGIKPPDVFDYVNMFCRQFPLLKVWLGHVFYVMIRDNNDIRIVLNSNKCIDKGDAYEFMKSAFRNGIATSKGATWKKHRKIISPAFTSVALQDFVKTFIVHTNALVENLYQVCEKKDPNIHRYIADCVTNTLLDSVMDIQVTDSGDILELRNHLSRLKDLFAAVMYKVWMHFNWIYKFSSLARETNKTAKFITDFWANIIAKKKAAYHEKGSRTTDTEKRKVFLDFLIEDTDFTDEELLDEVSTLIIAGTDTTATISGCIFVLLGIHSEIQEKVYEEIVNVLQDKEITNDDLQSLSYTRRVISETLRLFPAVPYITRIVAEDVQLDNKSCIIPAGANVLVNIYQLHRSPELWPDPYKFDPDRFLPEAVLQRPQASYIPFSYGPRNCIGPRYAMMFLTVLVAKIVKNFVVRTEYRTVQDIKLQYGVSMEPAHGYKLSLVPRK